MSLLLADYTLLQGGAAAGQLQRRRRPPRLTAANFRYFLRGRNAKAAASDVVVAARRRAHLAPYDRALRAFRYRWGTASRLHVVSGAGCVVQGRLLVLFELLDARLEAKLCLHMDRNSVSVERKNSSGKLYF